MLNSRPTIPHSYEVATLKIERLLDAADLIGVDLFDLELVRRRLVAHEAERERTWPSRRRRELDELVAQELETLCEGFVKLKRAVDERADLPDA
jgi:hypothetical protein